jgi:CHAD domain-containing protein
MAPQGLIFRAARPIGAAEIVALLRPRFLVRVESPRKQDLAYYDTFDARLHANGLVLCLGGGQLRLDSVEGEPLARERATSPPDFAERLPDGALRDAILPRTGIRRLLPLVDIGRESRTLRILDTNEKTIVRLRLEENEARPPTSTEGDGRIVPIPDLIRVIPVKGYERELEAVVEALEKAPGIMRGGIDEVVNAVEAIGDRLVENPCKFRPELDPATPTADAMRGLHRSLLDIVRLNEDGVRTALDTEFLHDYRVTIRRIRSALGQVEGVFPAEDLIRFAKEFKWLASATGPARDADVFLLKLPGYRATLPEKTRRDLDPLETFLLARRRRAYRTLAKKLGSERYATLLADWDAYLGETAKPSPSAPNAGRPLLDVASEHIAKVAERVLETGRAIDDDTPAAALHKLRLECKKLRYLLDLFSSLYQPKSIGRLLRDLKKLQDNLGDFNDCEVQQDTLQSFASEMAANGSTPVETFLAMGRLEDRLQIRQGTERQRFSRRFARFARPANRRRMHALFGLNA